MTHRNKMSWVRATIAAAAFAVVQPALSAQASDATIASGKPCQYERARLLALDYQVFDQTPGQGWRELTADDNCSLEAADLIREFRTTKNFPHPMLYWHEGQLRALGGATNDAVPLMELSRSMAVSIKGWNEYVDATISFLRKDRAAYDRARAALAAIPSAPYLVVVDRLGQCFAKSYIQAYRVCEK